MNVLAPIFMDHADRFWPTPEGQERLSHFLHMLADFSGGEAIVVTDHPESLPPEPCRPPALRLLTVPPPGPRRGLDKRLPGLAPALTAARAACPSDAWAVVNFRSVLLDVATLGCALRQFQQGTSELLVSVREPEDHPCQLQRPVQRNAQGLFLRIGTDAAGTTEPCGAATFEFCFNWASAGVHANAPGQLFQPVHVGGLLQFRPVHAQQWAQRHGDGVAWRFESPETARVLVPRRLLPAGGGLLPLAALLAPASPDPGEAPSMRIRRTHPDFQEVELTLAQPLDLGGEATISAVGPHGLLSGQTRTAPIAPGGYGCRFAAVEPGASGFLLAVTQYTDAPAHDGWEPFRPDIPLWRYSPITGACLRGDTGHEVTGRQAFPKVFELDASFFLATDQACARMEEILANGGAGYFNLANRSVIVRTVGDNLRAVGAQQLLRQADDRHEETPHG